MMEHLARTAALEELTAEIREIVHGDPEPGAASRLVAERMRPYLAAPDLLTAEQREPDPDRYRQHILHVEPDGSFSIVSLCWLPGQETPVHDHVSWCVVGVYQGLEHETSYRLETGEGGAEWLVETGSLSCTPGMVEALTPPGDIHKVSNAGDDLAISIHIYGADIGKLGSSILRRYEQEVRAG